LADVSEVLTAFVIRRNKEENYFRICRRENLNLTKLTDRSVQVLEIALQSPAMSTGFLIILILKLRSFPPNLSFII
jgi:hypothetical protein